MLSRLLSVLRRAPAPSPQSSPVVHPPPVQRAASLRAPTRMRQLYTLRAMLHAIGFGPTDAGYKPLITALMTNFLAKSRGSVSKQDFDQFQLALGQGTFEMYFDAVGRMVGLVMWQLFELDTSNSHPRDAGPSPGAPLGTDRVRPHILAFFCRDGSLLAMLADLRHRVFASYQSCTYDRIKKDVRTTKLAQRSASSGFVRYAAPTILARERWEAPNEELVLGVASHMKKMVLVGQCLLLLMDSVRHRGRHYRHLIRIVRNFTSLSQYRLHFSDAGEAIGLVTWSWLTDRTVKQVTSISLYDVHPAELNEGNRLCLVDAIFAASDSDFLIRDVVGDLCSNDASLQLFMPQEQGQGAHLRTCAASDVNELRRWVNQARHGLHCDMQEAA